MKKPADTLKAFTILSGALMLACMPVQGSELMAQEIQAAGEAKARENEEAYAAMLSELDFISDDDDETEISSEDMSDQDENETSVDGEKDTDNDSDTDDGSNADDFTSSWDGPVLTAWAGTVMGPSGKETYYNLDMSGVVAIMRGMGNNDEYWVREDGCKMLGDYIMCAANLDVHPRGALVESSLGTCIVCDTGGFAYGNPYQLDIATTW
ncbi:MAG: hypothetical protein IKE03_03865 [Blautia sp.]|nr:hypothetical protein [Blautia sp.]